MALPPLPKTLRSFDAPKLADQGRRVDEWARGAQTLLGALRDGDAPIQRRLAQLEADMAALEAAGGGGGSVVYGSPVALVVGGSNSNGVSTDVPRADHRHELPPFGTGSGEFCEGDDPRLDLGALDTFDAFDPDAPASSPHADDDDATSGSFAGAWTAWDPAGMATYTASGGRYQITATGNGGSRWCGRYRAVPASEFQVRCHVGLENSAAAGASQCGLILFDDPVTNPSTCDIRTVSTVMATAAWTAQAATWGQYDAGSSVVAGQTAVAPWVRFRVNGTSVASDYSPNGWNWTNISVVTLGFTPSHYGFGLRVVTTSAVSRGSFQHFRVVSGAGSSDFLFAEAGRNVRRPIAA